MIAIRLHGLGGQGVVTSAEILAKAAFAQGLQVQAFPFFGVERTGTPVTSYVRLDQKPIKIRQQIYQPDWLIILSDKVLDQPEVKSGLTTTTRFIINSQKTASILAKQLSVKPNQINTVDLSHLAYTNTALLGAWAQLSGLIKLSALKQALAAKLAGKDQEIIKANLEVLKQYD
ncbi:MAG: 2-oxoacid:acceptor oxidoreductase family protein [bacterium]